MAKNRYQNKWQTLLQMYNIKKMLINNDMTIHSVYLFYLGSDIGK